METLAEKSELSALCLVCDYTRYSRKYKNWLLRCDRVEAQLTFLEILINLSVTYYKFQIAR